MWPKRLRTYGLKVIAVAVLLGSALFGCGDDGPTGPEVATLRDLLGTQFFRADGTQVGFEGLDDTPLVGIYFASLGCPACGAFTPVLADVYNQLKEEGRSFEVVLVTLGISDSALFEFMSDSGMPWLAVSSQSDRAEALVNRYNVRWVPTLVVVDEAGKTISLAGRDEVMQSGTAAYDGWLAASGGS